MIILSYTKVIHDLTIFFISNNLCYLISLNKLINVKLTCFEYLFKVYWNLYNTHIMKVHISIKIKTQFSPVDKVEVVLASILHSIAVSVEMSWPLGANVLAIVSPECHGSITLPCQIKQCIGRSENNIQYLEWHIYT